MTENVKAARTSSNGIMRASLITTTKMPMVFALHPVRCWGHSRTVKCHNTAVRAVRCGLKEKAMSEAPERIWAAPPTDDPRWESGAGEWDVSPHWAADGITEYVRADRIEELEAENAKLRAAMHEAMNAVADAARARGEAEGKLAASETYGVLEGWIEKCAALEAKLAKAVDALVWCSGSADFNEGGVAYAGWNKVCRPIIAAPTGDKDAP